MKKENKKESRRGIIYKMNGQLVLTRHIGGLKFKTEPISDPDDLYTDLPQSNVDIVEVDHHEVTQTVITKPIFGITLYKNNIPVKADEAVPYSIKMDPKALVKLIYES